MEKEEYVVLNNCGEQGSFEQESTMLTIRGAVKHIQACQKIWPENYYYVARILPLHEILKVIEEKI